MLESSFQIWLPKDARAEISVLSLCAGVEGKYEKKEKVEKKLKREMEIFC
jgi:hypothetical protein